MQTPSQPPGTTSSAGTVSVQAKIGAGLVQVSAQARRDAAKAYRVSLGRRTLSATIQSVVATGTLYTSYGGYQSVTASTTVNTTSIPTSVSLSFSNAPIANNQWVFIDVVGYDGPNGTGSHLDLGQLAGLLNVAASPASASIDINSTARFQVVAMAMLQGIISSYDLQNETTLDGDIGNVIASTAVNTGTGVYTNQQLVTFVNTLYQSYNRTITVTGNGQPSVATVVFNFSDAGERDFVYNLESTLSAFPNLVQSVGTTQASSGPLPFYVIGNPFNGQSQLKLGTPGKTPVITQVSVTADAIDASGGSTTIQHVYGGKITVTMQAAPAVPSSQYSFVGGSASVNGRPTLDKSTIAVPVASSSITMTMVDPQAAAFGSAPYYAQSAVSGQTLTTTCDYAGYTQCHLPGSQITNVSGTNVSVAFNTVNPFALAASNLQVCTGLDCFPLVSGATNTVRAPFYDSGTNLQYYGWSPGTSTVSGVTAATGGGYQVAYANGTTGSIQSSTPAYFYPQQDVQVVSSAPVGTDWALSMTCSGATVSSTGVQQQDGFADLYVMNLGSAGQCSGITLQFSLPSGTATSGTVTLSSLGIAPSSSF